MLKLVYPTNGHTQAEASTFLLGSVGAGEHLTLNGQPQGTSPKGFFACKVPLVFGINTYTLITNTGDSRSITITRSTLLGVAPGSLAPDMLPTVDNILMPGDWLTLACAAGEGSPVMLDIPGILASPVTMTASPEAGFMDNRQVVFAELAQLQGLIPRKNCYQATFQIPPNSPAVENAAVSILRDGVSKPLSGKVTIWNHPQFGRVTRDLAPMRVSPPEGSRLSPQRLGANAVVTGKQGNWWRIRLNNSRNAWIASDKLTVQALPPDQGLNLPALTVQTHPLSPNQSQVQMPGLSTPVPFNVDSRPDGLTVDLFGVVSHCDFIHYHPDEAVIQQVEWSQPDSDTFRLALTIPGLCGYDVSFDNNLMVLVKRLPRQPRILLDPGHGGSETGSVGPDGTPEKTLNLTVSLLIADALKSYGYPVDLTRQTDVEVSLVDRSRLAESYDLVLSLHHNALPDGRDPQKAQGLSTYYYHPFSKALAAYLLEGLTQVSNGIPKYGLLYDSLAMTRIPQAMAVLTEIGFMTHPQEYERLTSSGFQAHFAQAYAQCIHTFLNRSVV